MRQYLLLLAAVSLLAVEPQLPAPQLNTQTHWYGNTWGGGSGPKAPYVQQNIDDLAVAGGRIYAITGWDEHCGEATIYTTDGAKVTVPAEGGDWAAQFHSWGYSGGPAVAVSATHVFYSMGQNGEAKHGTYAGVARYSRDGAPAGWPQAIGGHRLKISDGTKPTGLAVRGDELFVSDPAGKRIAVFGATDLQPRRDIACAEPGRLAVELAGDQALWMISGKRVVRLDAQGKELAAITDCLLPAALAIDPRQGDVLVADAAPERMCIRRYAATTWKRTGNDFGAPIWSGAKPGAVGPARFYRINAIACDADGSLYVSDAAFGNRLHKFDATGAEVWVRQGLEFVTCADADPGDENTLYSRAFRYAIDPSKPPGESWKAVAMTIDPVRYPEDPRLKAEANLSIRMFRIDGQRIMTGRAQMAAQIYFWRFSGDIAVPAAGWWPAGAPKDAWPTGHPEGAFVWCDDNGDGAPQTGEYRSVPAAWFTGQSAFVDGKLGLWCTSGTWDAGKGAIQRLPLAALSKQGVPTWDATAATSTPIPTDSGIQVVSKLSYDALNDRLYLGCFTKDHSFKGGGWEQMATGPVLQRFDAWTTAPKLAWERLLVPPEGLVGGTPKAWSFEAEHAFVASTWKHEQLAVDVWRLSDGMRVGRLLPTADIGGVTGWIDMNDAVQSHRRKDGSYLVTCEEVWMAKGLFWLWKP